MRRVALIALLLGLTGCGTSFDVFLGNVSTLRRNVNQPQGDSETMRRIRAQPVDLPPLVTEPGNVWPGPVAAEPTLQDLERGPNGVQSAPQQAVPGAPNFRPRGSSTPPGSTQPGLPNEPTAGVEQPPRGPNGVAAPSGRIYQTPRGPAVSTGTGTAGTDSVITPGGRSAITIPNGNGTSTLIGPDGSVQTIPTPK
jgi:hypothetical protein